MSNSRPIMRAGTPLAGALAAHEGFDGRGSARLGTPARTFHHFGLRNLNKN
ncbi:MAG TPA: hypothetical protein VHZ53_12040 [Steroidobacteraceae bacterium]|nr:hypothetical protein [Steroidobacteraceae bacterium]